MIIITTARRPRPGAHLPIVPALPAGAAPAAMYAAVQATAAQHSVAHNIAGSRQRNGLSAFIRIFMVYTSFVLHKRLFMFCQSRFDEICPASEFSNSCLFQRSIYRTHNPKRGEGRRPLPNQLVHSRHLLQISLHGKLEHKASRFLINCLQHCFADYVLRAGLNCQALITFAPDG